MTRDEVIGRLEALGTAQARKTYARHGAGENMFGVSFANLYKLKKQVRTDHALARQLWKTRNLEAQWLATMIADPGEIDSREADDWAKDSQHHGDGMGSFLADLVARSECADEKMRACFCGKGVTALPCFATCACSARARTRRSCGTACRG